MFNRTHFTKIHYLVLMTMVFGLMSCSSKKQMAVDAEKVVPRESFSFSQQQDFDLLSSYLIQPGDVLDVLFQIRTWLEKAQFKIAVDHTVEIKFVHTPELNEVQRVRPNGRISLPYQGEYYIVGKTIDEVERDIKNMYKDILREPDLFVLVPEFQDAIKELKKDLHTAPRGLSRLVTVRPDGVVTFPMIGEVKVANKTITSINESLNKDYERMISGLHVDLFLEKHSGSRIYVLGQVNRPNTFKISKPVTVSQALALAGSFKNDARLDSVFVVRKNGNEMVSTRLNLKKSGLMGGNGGLFYLFPDDIVYVPRKRISKTTDLVRDLRDLFLFRGWGISLSWTHRHEDNDIDENIVNDTGGSQ